MRRSDFLLPNGIYLDGNSLGPAPKTSLDAIARRTSQWQEQAVAGWDDWFLLAERLSPKLASLIGAKGDEVTITPGLTVGLHAVVASLYRPTGARRNIVATELDFPSDLYALAAWAQRADAELVLVRSRDGHTIEEADIAAAFGDEVALALLPTVIYRSGQLLDVRAVTAKAREAGILIGWDAAHSIGCLSHQFHDDGADFAVWCSYKYLNAGPGAPGGLFVHRRHHHLSPGLAGWWGSDKTTQFRLEPVFQPAEGAGRYQIGTPSILALAGLEGALALFDDVGIDAIRRRSLELTDYLMERADQDLPELSVVTPRPHPRRGGHAALKHHLARRLSVRLRSRGITADFRPPDLLRLAPVALYTTFEEVDTVVKALRELLSGGELNGDDLAGEEEGGSSRASMCELNRRARAAPIWPG